MRASDLAKLAADIQQFMHVRYRFFARDADGHTNKRDDEPRRHFLPVSPDPHPLRQCMHRTSSASRPGGRGGSGS